MDAGNNRVLIYDYPLSNGQAANVVLGQASFTSKSIGLGATGMNDPLDAAEDSAGNLYVSDCGNNRVLQFKPPFTNGMAASLVLGQPDLLTGTATTTQTGLSCPVGMAFDSTGNLWVVDFFNNRVLQYQPPFATGMNASLVIGQSNFTSSAKTGGSSGLGEPEFIAFDASGDLWVSDTNEARVLRFSPPFSNGMNANLVLGHDNFTTVTGSPIATANSFATPEGLAFDSSGNLWVADTFNNRVVQFVGPFTNGMNASVVLGQASLTTNAHNVTQDGFNYPSGIAFDSMGKLAVAQWAIHRTTIFQAPFSNGQNAILVLGQPDFSVALPTTTATGESGAFSVRPLF